MWIDWATQSFEPLNRSEKLDFSTDQICKPQEDNRIVAFHLFKNDYYWSKRKCLALGGEIAFPAENRTTSQIIGSPFDSCEAFWAPYVHANRIQNGKFSWVLDRGKPDNVNQVWPLTQFLLPYFS